MPADAATGADLQRGSPLRPAGMVGAPAQFGPLALVFVICRAEAVADRFPDHQEPCS